MIMKDNVFLNSELAQRLYDRVKTLPIIDYHNHLSVKDIAENRRYRDIYDLWIAPDPYKHRAMRMMGVEENKITGNASAYEKFEAWCSVFPHLTGNVLYIWSLMELRTFLGCDDVVPCKENAKELYQRLNEFLSENEVTPRYFLDKAGTELVCPCCSVADDTAVFENNNGIAPSVRGDDVTTPDFDFIKKLQDKSGVEIKDLDSYKMAVAKRIEQMKKAGLKFADNAIDDGFLYYPDDGKNESRFEKLLKGEKLCIDDKNRLFCHLVVFLAGEYGKNNIVLQLHIGALRFTSTRLRNLAGAAGGYAAMAHSTDFSSLTQMLDDIEKGEGGLPRIILFTLNPSDDAAFSVLSGSYSKDGVRGLITQGPAWWWCDHKQGIEKMLENTAVYGVLSNFAGMTTDSRSFLSLVRHDYFRRILCNFVAEKSIKGEFLDNEEALTGLVENLCYYNAKRILEE